MFQKLLDFFQRRIHHALVAGDYGMACELLDDALDILEFLTKQTKNTKDDAIVAQLRLVQEFLCGSPEDLSGDYAVSKARMVEIAAADATDKKLGSE